MSKNEQRKENIKEAAGGGAILGSITSAIGLGLALGPIGLLGAAVIGGVLGAGVGAAVGAANEAK